MLLDIICLVILLYTFYKGYTNGILHSIFFLLAFIVGILAALKLSYLMSVKLEEWFSIGTTLLPVISFLLMFILAALAVIMLGKLLEGVLKVVQLNIFNRIAGALIWMFAGILLFSTLLWYMQKYMLLPELMIEESYSYSIAAPVSPYIVSTIGEMIPFLGELYGSIGALIEKLGKEQLPEDIL